MRKRYDDDDDDDDGRILRDGERVTVGMMMRDSMSPLQKAIAEDSRANGRDKFFRDAIETASPVSVTDAFGSTAGLSRPGYRFLRTGPHTTDHAIHATHEVDEAYRLHDEEESRRWQGSDREIEVEPITGDSLRDSYAAYDFYMSNAWRAG
jgi:hypothetical protein